MDTTRRRLTLAGGAVAASTWVAPSVLTLDRAAAASPSGSGLIGMTGVTFYDPPPASVAMNVLQSDATASAFAESPCTVLTSALRVNRATPGSFGGGSNESALIPVGMSVCSWYLNADRSSNGRLQGSMTFSAPILGLIYLGGQLSSSSWMEIPGTTYPSASGHPFEGNDSLTLSTNTVTWDAYMGGTYSDGMRIITAC